MTRRIAAGSVLAIAALSAIVACSKSNGADPPPTAPPSSSASPSASSTPTVAPSTSATMPAGVSPSPTHSASATATPTPGATATPIASTTPTPVGSPTATPLAGLNARLHLQSGFYGNTIASTIPLPRQLVALPNGDLLVGSKATRGSYDNSGPCSSCSSTVYLIPNAEGSLAAGTPVAFATVPDAEAQGIAYSPISNSIYIATTFGVWSVPYHTGDQKASAVPIEIVHVRTGSIAPASDGDVHSTTSVTVSGSNLYIGVGSSCNRCAEVDATRAVVLKTDLSGGSMTTVATRIRNAIALATNPTSGNVWVGGAGQDCVVPTIATSCGGQSDAYKTDGHPYEYMDPVTLHGSGTADYGWPNCEEDHTEYVSPAVDCSKTVVPLVESPAYSTIIGAAFYPPSASGAYVFPASYSGGLFMAFHGSWHEGSNGIQVSVPNVVFVPMSGDAPKTAFNWASPNPTSQWSVFLTSYQDNSTGTRYGQPTGLAVGPQGSLFVADDYAGVVYRLRPGSAPAGAAHLRRAAR